VTNSIAALNSTRGLERNSSFAIADPLSTTEGSFSVFSTASRRWQRSCDER
jgi:hypothetical protein